MYFRIRAAIQRLRFIVAAAIAGDTNTIEIHLRLEVLRSTGTMLTTDVVAIATAPMSTNTSIFVSSVTEILRRAAQMAADGAAADPGSSTRVVLVHPDATEHTVASYGRLQVDPTSGELIDTATGAVVGQSKPTVH